MLYFVHIISFYRYSSRGRGNSHLKGMGMLIEKFELNQETNLGVAQGLFDL